MKRQFLAGAALAALMAGSAFAADMPLKAAAPIALYDWGGMYLGGVVGGAWGTNDISDPGLGIVGTLLGVPVVQTNNPSGFIGGIEGGSRYQFGKLVIGTEADITWGDLNNTSTSGFGAPLLPPGVITRSLTADTKWTATAVSTVGIAHNNWLLYGKAGVAWEKVDYTDNWSAAGVNLFNGTGSDSRVGWTVGTGVEWAFNNSWSVKVEYDYLDFGTRNVAINGSLLGLGIQPGIQDSNHVNQLKAGLNWHIMPNLW
jgi:outer membrane immunogenic protein